MVVTKLEDKTFYAELHLVLGGQSHVISSRPSDAIALAVRTGTPIFANESVIDEAGFQEVDEVTSSSEDGEEVVEQFKEFIDSISPEDFSD